MNLGLQGCAAIVTGSSSGMGRAVADALAAEGATVMLAARREDRLRAAVEAIGSDRAGYVAGDSTDPSLADRLVAETLRRFGRLDIVVNNTGGPPAGGFADFGEDDWLAAWQLSVASALRLTRAALPHLRASGRGRVVNITSSAVKEISDGLLLSNALRPAVIGWAKTLSREEGPHGITVNSIAPGFIDTERLEYLYSLGDDPESDKRRDEAAIPARRFGRPDEIASTVAFLCSDQAAYISGVTVLVDGGLARGLLS